MIEGMCIRKSDTLKDRHSNYESLLSDKTAHAKIPEIYEGMLKERNPLKGDMNSRGYMKAMRIEKDSSFLKGLIVKNDVLSIVMILVLYLLISGCASIIHGTTQDIPIVTTPDGAIAKTGDGVECKTPCKLTLKRKQDHVIQIKKDGFEDYTVTCHHVVSGAVASDLITGGLIGWGVDALSGGQHMLV